MLQLKPNILNTIYVISNMHLNHNLGIRSSGHFSLQKVSPLCEGERVRAWVQFLCKLPFFFLGRGNNILTFFFFSVLNFPKIRVRFKMTLPFLSP
jgi:hypothetical protein